jgi:hypothetical protein
VLAIGSQSQRVQPHSRSSGAAINALGSSRRFPLGIRKSLLPFRLFEHARASLRWIGTECIPSSPADFGKPAAKTASAGYDCTAIPLKTIAHGAPESLLKL